MRTAPVLVIPGPVADRPTSVEELLDLLTIDYQEASGDEIEGWCPFHDGRKPNFGINTSSGLWLCRASCYTSGGSGTLAQLVERLRDVPYRDARRWVNQVDLDAELTDPALPEMVRVEVEFKESALDWATDPPTWALRDRGISREAARQYGILWDAEDEAWVLPFRDPDSGVLKGWQIKTANRFINTPNTHKSHSLFGIDVFASGSTAILVESPLDCAVLLTAGVAGGLSSFGALVSQRQAELLADRASVIVAALDNDDAGRMGQAKLLERLSRLHSATRVVGFNYGNAPKRKDPGEMTDAEIKWALRHAVLVGQ